MRIINLLSLEEPDIKPAVRQLADNRDRILGRKGQMLLDLVNHLEVDGAATHSDGTPPGGPSVR